MDYQAPHCPALKEVNGSLEAVFTKSGGAENSPASCIVEDVRVYQFSVEELVTPAPINKKDLSQNRSTVHSCTVMLKSCLVQLAHSRIYDRKASLAKTPLFKDFFVVAPVYMLIKYFVDCLPFLPLRT